MTPALAQWRVTAGVRHAHAGGGKAALCGAEPLDAEGVLTVQVCRRCMARYHEQAQQRAAHLARKGQT